MLHPPLSSSIDANCRTRSSSTYAAKVVRKIRSKSDEEPRIVRFGRRSRTRSVAAIDLIKECHRQGIQVQRRADLISERFRPVEPNRPSIRTVRANAANAVGVSTKRGRSIVSCACDPPATHRRGVHTPYDLIERASVSVATQITTTGMPNRNNGLRRRLHPDRAHNARCYGDGFRPVASRHRVRIRGSKWGSEVMRMMEIIERGAWRFR